MQDYKKMSKKLKPFFGKKICVGCKNPATVLVCKDDGNLGYCEECKNKFNKKPFNGMKL